MDNVYWFSIITGFFLLLVINHFIQRKRLKAKTSDTECEDKDCVRCKKYSEIKTKAVLLYNEHTRKMFPEDILRLQRIKSSIEHLHHIQEDKRQHPNVFFMDSLLSQPWLEKTTTEIDQDCATMEENVNKIHSELMIALDNNEDHWLVNNTPTGCWQVFHLINQGNIIERNVSLVPHTFNVVSRLQSIMQGTVFANVAFSVIYPGTRISDHFGPTNIRLRCHLGLVTSPLCSITVDGVTKSWQYGKTLIFDDSFLHGVEYKEASADEMRAILMVDIWQPDITVEEKQALRFMFGSD